MALENDNKDSPKSAIISSPEGDKKSMTENPAGLKGFEKNTSNKKGWYLFNYCHKSVRIHYGILVYSTTDSSIIEN